MEVKIFNGTKEIGKVQKISFNENQDGKVFGDGDEWRFDKEEVKDLFTREIVHKNVQKMPFNIVIEDKDLKTTITNVWIEKTAHQYATEDFIVIDALDWVAEKVEK